MINWASKRLRVALFIDGEHWIAADLRSYWVAQGKTPVEAIRALIFIIRASEILQKEDEKKGHKVIRWKCYKKAQDHIIHMERRAKKDGLILDGVDWRTSFIGNVQWGKRKSKKTPKK